MRLSKIIALGLLTASLCACSKHNPLMTPEYIAFMHENFFFEEPKGFPVKECTDFYTGIESNQSLQNKCDSWSAHYYDSLVKAGGIPAETSLVQFRDKKYWLAVKNYKVNK